jgi:NAD(P)-dependent dehydrogenase (short-subunit alcohol dehydrogenase family)
MDLRLDRRVILLVGGSGSIGRATQGVLRDEGAIVVNADAETTSPDVAIDVTDPASVQRAVNMGLSQHGRIDGLVVLSAIFSATPAVAISPDEWDQMLDVNLKGSFLAAREVLPHMQRARFGRIVMLASLAGQIGGAVAGAHYAASKAAVLSLVKSLAKQARRLPSDEAKNAHAQPAAGEFDITVNAVSPGPVESAMTRGWTAAEREKMTSSIPAGRFAEPQEIADVIAWLVSPRVAYIHGARIDVNGGVLMA